uniref:RGS domain-containing protein n=1 Tax=Globodera pallida TaxID=36090 RepID=A0A183C7X4_GLOPA
MKHFPKDWLPILLLITMIAYSVSVPMMIEDGTPEEEDLAKALTLSKRFFWRTMMENWECLDKEMAIDPKEIGAKHEIELKQICERWKVKALATDAFLKSWESHEGESISSSSANILKTGLKPLFSAGGRELQLSSAMEAIKAAYRVLFGWRAAAEFNTKIDFMNLSDFLRINNAQKISPKGKLNQSKLEEKENGQKRDYLEEYYEKLKNLDFTEKNDCFLEYWDSIQELGLDMEMTCKKDIMEVSESLFRRAVPNTKKMHLERFVGEVFFNYTHLIRNPMLKKYPDELKELEPLLDPCEEAKLKVKKTEGTSSSG